MNTNFIKTEQWVTKFQKINAKVIDWISYGWSYACLKVQVGYSIAKLLAIKFAELLREHYCKYQYPMIGIGAFTVVVMSYSIIRKLFQKRPNQKNQKQKKTLTDEQTTYQSLESGHKSEDSFLSTSLKLPMDAIMEQDNEDDAEDRIFFEVYKNYSHT